jgi:hypothetical protein
MICYASSHHVLNTSRAFRDHIKLKSICKKHVKSWTHLGPSEITICFTVLSKQRSVTPLSMFDANLQCETLQLWNVAKKSGTGVDHFEHLQRSWKSGEAWRRWHLHIWRVTRKGKAWRSRRRRFRELQEHLCMPRVTRKGKAWRSKGRRFRELQEHAKSERKDKAWRSRGRRDLEESSSSSCSVIVAAKKLSTHKQLHCSYANQNRLRSKVNAKKVFFLSSESSFVVAVVPCICCSTESCRILKIPKLLFCFIDSFTVQQTDYI